MNGRVYNYNLGRFLSVDPFIQAPGNSQSMNPYSYIMNNPLSGTDPTGYKKASAGSTTIWSSSWANNVKVIVESNNGQRELINTTRGAIEKGEVESLENRSLEDGDSITMIETVTPSQMPQTGSTENTNHPRTYITDGVYHPSVTINQLEGLETDWKQKYDDEEISISEWVYGDDKILKARYSKRRQQSAKWLVQAQLINMRMITNDLQRTAATVMGGAVAIPLTAYGVPYFSGFVSFLNSQTPMQALLTSGSGGGLV